MILVINKCDLPGVEDPIIDRISERTVRISAKEGTGISELLENISELLRESRVLIDEVVPYSEGSRLAMIRKYGQLLSEEYEGDGVHIKAYVPTSIVRK